MNKHFLMTIGLALFAAFTLSACNTMEGVGKDMTRAGEKIEEAAKKK